MIGDGGADWRKTLAVADQRHVMWLLTVDIRIDWLADMFLIVFVGDEAD